MVMLQKSWNSTKLSLLLRNLPLCYAEDVDCSNGSVQLVDGDSSKEGRVELCSNRVWTTIEDNGWDYNDARVVCRQLGYDDQCKTMLA